MRETRYREIIASDVEGDSPVQCEDGESGG
jgi:hypothetical protein